jgi:1-deoxy-D-xylulose-5-phosphate reductoisomerase
LAAIATLTFEAPDPIRFPALALARAALQSGGSAPTVLNAANEEAVAAFLAGRIGFLDIVEIVGQTLQSLSPVALGSIDDVLAQDGEARACAQALINKRT